LPKYPLLKIEAILGFAAKAGKIVAGEQAVRAKLRQGSVLLIVVAEDASDEITRYYSFKGNEMEIPVICSGTKLELGLAVGKSQRAVLGIIDRGFAASILKRVREKAGMD
jgi:ribosomal protein L7Ae-like RNA K-turn-binding protein